MPQADAKSLIESVAQGESPRRALEEGMDSYSMGYKVEDLLSSVSHNIGTARSVMVKAKAYMPSMDGDKKKVMQACHDSLGASLKKLEGAETELTKAVQSMEKYKKAGGSY